MTLPFAFSISHFVDHVGAYAGFASVLAVAVLALLVFSQARELRRLRDWAGRAPERAAEQAQRVGQQAEVSRRVQAQPIQAQPARAVPAQQRAVPAAGAAAGAVSRAVPASADQTVALAPSAPAGLGGPALASATRKMVPTAATNGAEADAEPAVSVGPGQAAAGATQVADRPAALAGAGGATAAPVATAATAPPATGGPATTTGPATGGNGPAPTAAPGTNGHTDEHRLAPSSAAATLRPARPAGGAPPQRRPGPVPAAGGAGVRAGSTVAGRASAARRPPDSDRDPLRSRWLKFAGILGVIVVIGVVLALVLGNSGSSSPKRAGGSNPAPAGTGSGSTAHRPKSFARGGVTVAVLNGTTQPGLAQQVADELVKKGFQQGTVTNAPDQARSATAIAYTPGHRSDALQVKRFLRFGAIQPIDDVTKQIVCPTPGQCAPTVVVTVGADRPTAPVQ